MALELFSLFAKISLDSSEFDKGLDKTKKSMSDYKKDVMTLAQTYKQQGMSMSDAMKKAYSEIDKSQYETASVSEKTSKTVSGNWSGAADKLGAVGGKIKDALGVAFKAAAVGLTAASAGVVAFGKSSVDAGISFDSAMSQIAATLGMSVQDIQNNVGGAGDTFDMLRKKAMEMGASTNFSAKEAADGLNILAMSGYDAESSVSMIEDVLHLAAAGAMDMGNAAAYISGTMKGFNDATKDSGYYADLMAKGATLANTSVSQLGEAMSSGAAGAAAYKQSADSMTLSLLRLAEQGEVGSAAGTALAAAMKDIYTPTDQAKKALDKLGVSAYENGKALDFNEVVNRLSTALSGLSDEQANEYKQTIFGIQGLNAFNKMVVTGTEKQTEWAQALASASDGMGEAAKQYDTMTDNLQGDLDNLSSAWEGMQIVVSDQLTPAVREFVQFGTSGITAVTDAFKREEAVRGLSDAIRDAEGNLLSAGQVAGVLSETLYSMSESDRQIAVREIFNTDDMEYVNELLNENGENWGYLMGYVAEIDAASEATNGWAAAMSTLGPVVSDAVSMILNGLPKAVEIGGQLLGAVLTGIIDAIPTLADGAARIASAFADYLMGEVKKALDSVGILEPVTEAFSGVGDAFDRMGESVSPLIEKFKEWATSEETAQDATGLLATSLTLLGDTMSVAAGFISDIVDVGSRLATTITDNIALFAGLAGAAGAFMTALEINTLMGFATQLGGLTGILSAVQGAVSTATIGFKGAFAILAANPIIAVVTVIGFLVTAFITAYKTSEDFRNKVNGALQAVKTFIDNFVAAVDNFFTVTIPNAFQATIAKVTEVKNTIVSKFNEAADFIASLPGKFYQWGKDMMDNFKRAIAENPITNAISGVANTVASFLHHSTPDVGPLKDDDTWMPDMMRMFADGIESNTPLIGDAAQEAAESVSSALEPARDWAAEIGEYVSVDLANGIEKKATKAQQAAEKVASNIYNGLSEWADKTTKYERLSLEEQLDMWNAILARFKKGTEQWADAYDKVWDIQEKIADERAKAEEQRINQRIKAEERRIKYASLSLSEQADIWRDIQRDFEVGSDDWWNAYDKVFDLEKKIADEREKASEKAAQDSYSAVKSWLDKATKYTDASYTTQMRAWRQALGAFEKDSEQYADIEEKLFDLRLSAYEEYADNVEKISGKIDDIQKSYDDAVEKRAQAIAGSYKLFAAIPEKQEASGKELLKNLQGQIKSIRSFYSNLTKLQERGMSAAVVDEIRSMGVGASDELEALLKLSDKKLEQYADLYAEKQSLANSIAISELDGLKNETESKIQEQMDGLKKLYEESAPAIGQSFAENLAQGIRNGLSGVTEAAMEAAQAAINKTREILGIGTPMNAAPTRFPAYSPSAPAYNSAAASGDNAGLRYSPITLTVNNNVGGATYAQLQYAYDSAEAIRRGPSIINA